MRFLSSFIVASTVLAVANAQVKGRARTRQNDAPRIEGDTYWQFYLQNSLSVTQQPSSEPTPQPSSEPTPATPDPTTDPTAGPTDGPTVEPTPGPTPAPSEEPSAEPSPEPSPAPSAAPSSAPTGACSIDLDLTCRATLPGTFVPIDCTDIPPIDGLVCSCADCVRNIEFIYTGSSCVGDEGADVCEDFTPAPGSTASLTFTPCDSDAIILSGTFSVDEVLSVTLGGTACLPDCLEVTVADPNNGALLQQLKIDSSCDGRGLLLKDSYGALDFVGYSCDENDVNNCFQEILYGVEVCNGGIEEQFLYDFSFSFMSEPTDFLNGADIPFASNTCIREFAAEVIDRCLEKEICAMASANATNPDTGIPFPCEDEEEICFTIPLTTLPPTPAPSPEPTPEPSPEPSAAPSPEPSSEPSSAPSETPSTPPTPEVPLTPPPTGDCDLDVVINPNCPDVPCNFDRCLERPFRMLFRMDIRLCSESILRRCPGVDPDSCDCIRDVVIPEDDWPEQKFECQDFNGGPQRTVGQYYVTATPEKDDDVLYFDGFIDVPGGRFNATDPDLDRVEANTFLRLYDYDAETNTIGPLLQEVLFHSSCSQQLYLLDIFGSFQLIEFENNEQGVIGFATTSQVNFGITLDIAGDLLELEFLSVVVLSGVPGLLPPQVIEPTVTGIVIPPPATIDAEVTLIPNQDFDVITTIGGQLNGIGCFDVSQTTVNCGAVGTPIELRTIPFEDEP